MRKQVPTLSTRFLSLQKIIKKRTLKGANTTENVKITSTEYHVRRDVKLMLKKSNQNKYV